MKPKLIISCLLILLSGNLFSQIAPEPAKKTLFFEKVYLHLDRDFFYAGEDIWFKSYLLNAQGNQLLPTSNNLYVELINPNHIIEDRKVIRLENGIGKGDFKLNDSITPGNYIVRAYTNWMLNFGDNFIFEKKINVGGVEGVKSAVKSNAAATNSSKVAVPAVSELIRFFPEGGSMIEDVTGALSFKIENAAGKGIKARGEIFSANGELVTSFGSNELGMGSFTLKPEAGIIYQAKGMYDSKPFSAKLPVALPQGFSMHLMPDSVKTTVIISTNEATLTAYKGKELEIKARHAGLAYFTKTITLESLITKLIIPNESLPDGIASITLVDDKLRPHCERLVFINKGGLTDKILLSTSKTNYRSKEQTTIRIKTTDNTGKPVRANLSLAVVDAGIVPVSHGNIISYINLESELKGEIEKPESYFNPKNPARFKQLDLLLMTQGWRDFIWKRLKDTTLTISHLNETGFTISGDVKDKSGKTPLVGANVTLFATGAKGQKLLGATTDNAGKYYFDNMNLEGNQGIKLVSVDTKGKKTGMIFLDSLYSKPLSVKPFDAKVEESPAFAAFKKAQVSRIQEMKKFDLADTITLKEVEIKSSKVVGLFGENVISFGYPDQSFVITDKDDKDYKSLRHYLLTNVDGASPDSNMETNGVVFFSQGKPVRPRFLVDRREDLFDRLDYYELSMKDVQKIVVRHMIGSPQQGQSETDSIGDPISTGGIGFRDVYLIYLTLKPSAFGRNEPYLLNTRVNGYYQDRVFYEPRYPQGIVSTKQDLRTTVYWKPIVLTDEIGEATVTYFNADPKTPMRVVVEGINAKGMPVVGDLTYEVK